jgi:hypothetical protein
LRLELPFKISAGASKGSFDFGDDGRWSEPLVAEEDDHTSPRAATLRKRAPV